MLWCAFPPVATDALCMSEILVCGGNMQLDMKVNDMYDLVTVSFIIDSISWYSHRIFLG